MVARGLMPVALATVTALGVLSAATPSLAKSAADATPIVLAQAAPSGVLFLVQNDWCGDYQPGMRDPARLSGRNRDRLAAAPAELAPGFQAAQARTGLMLLANYQAELEASRPNGTLAASYLAVASTVPLTVPRIVRVNALLCVTATERVVGEIAAEAAQQRPGEQGR